MPERVDQGLAAAAAAALRDLDVTDDLRTRMRGLPVMLQTSGLTATCAFLLSKVNNQEDSYWVTAKILLDEAAKAVGIDQHPDPHVTLNAFSQETAPGFSDLGTINAALLLHRLWLADARDDVQTALREAHLRAVAAACHEVPGDLLVAAHARRAAARRGARGELGARERADPVTPPTPYRCYPARR